MAHDMGNYVEVKDRVRIFREKHAEGSLQPVNPEQPYALEYIEVGDSVRCFIVYTAAAYRSPDDPRPGIGIAWEPFPGLTPFTKNSELMNAETSAWGRAIVAALAADADGAIATAEDVQKRRAEDGATAETAKPKTGGSGDEKASDKQVKAIYAIAGTVGWSKDHLAETLMSRFNTKDPRELTMAQAKQVIDGLKKLEEQAKSSDAE